MVNVELKSFKLSCDNKFSFWIVLGIEDVKIVCMDVVY